ncbi:sugar ABC transporter ATP-binding protein [Celeribacter sp.]|uniref:sugar ABC transporter ATP-binding protein n=1 Tax=Celeribacter sp. TaxID=1890673 RepID=UPI003A93B1D2
MGNLLLQAKGVAKSYNGVPALTNGEIAVQSGKVHALCGGNGAGKSTFLNILMGLTASDSGEIYINGTLTNINSPSDALDASIAIITQELSLVEDLTVAENIALGREPTRLGAINYKEITKRGQELLDRLGFPIAANALISSLSVARKQLVEVARAINCDAKILIMDEPTSALGEADTQMLFQAIQGLKSHGVGIIYVSHRLSELFEICDEYTIFRDGKFVQSGNMADLDRHTLVQLIVGRPLHRHVAQPREARIDKILEVKGAVRRNEFHNISLSLSSGEILGVYGLVGSGRSEFLNCLYGLSPFDEGEMFLHGEKVTITSPRDAQHHRIALITEDRKETGLVGCRSVRENIALSSLSSFSRFGFVLRERERQEVAKMIKLLQIKTASQDLLTESLSGGNQQKVVFARCLLTEPRLLLCDEPTRGVDEGAKQQIFKLIEDFVARDNGAIVVSSELDEILQVSDRILVFRDGALAGMVNGDEATHANLTELAT